MLIKVLSELGFDLSEEDVVRELAERLPHISDAELILDLSGCILDYPATSILIDEAIDRLQMNPPPRRLKLNFNIPFQPRVFEKWFFFGSKFLPEKYHALSSEELRGHLNAALAERETAIEISQLDTQHGGVTRLVLYE